jgi:hypothetical protein
MIGLNSFDLIALLLIPVKERADIKCTILNRIIELRAVPIS